MTLLEEIAFVIESRGWRNTFLLKLVSTSVRDNQLNRELVDNRTLKRLDFEKKSQEKNI